jgi:hypothetical protein
MNKVSKSLLEEYLEALYREVLEFYKYGLPLPRKTVETITSSMLKLIVEARPPKGFFKVFNSEEVARALVAWHMVKELKSVLSRVVDNAVRYLVTKRSFELEESWSLKGAVVWPLTIKNFLSFRPPVVAVYTRALSEPEYMLLKSVIFRVVNVLSTCERELSIAVEKARLVTELLRLLAPKGFTTLAVYILNEVRLLLREIEVLIDSYPLRFVHVPRDIEWNYINKLVRAVKAKPWRPKWVEDVISLKDKVRELEQSLKSLVNIVEVLHKRADESTFRDVSRAVRFLAFRLYEVYTYMVTATAVVRALGGSVAEVLKRGLKVYYDYGRSIIMVYGKKPGASIIEKAEAKWLTGEAVNRELLEKLAGRPDIGLYNEVKVVIETKFSNSLPYLTQARFKTLAYIYEYNADAGILAYPGPISGKGMDSEERQTKELLKKAQEKGGLELRLQTGKKLYILPLPPTQTEANIEKMRRILEMLVFQ